MEMNMKQLKYVLVLAKAGSFSVAADELGISQPSLSQYIKKIEKQIGLALFDRFNGNIRLTDAGRVYIDCGQKILNIEHQMETQFSDISANKTGSIIVGTAPYRSASMMPEISSQFRKIYSGIRLIIEEDVASNLLERSEKGEFDLCLTTLPVDEKIFSYEEILEEELVIAVPASFPKLQSSVEKDRKYPVIDIKELNTRDFIMVTESQVMQRALNELCDEYGLVLNTVVRVKSLEAQINMVCAGVGMALVPTGIEKFCHGEEVRFYSLRQELPRRHVAAIWRKDRVLPVVVKKLLQVMHDMD